MKLSLSFARQSTFTSPWLIGLVPNALEIVGEPATLSVLPDLQQFGDRCV